MFQKLIFFIKYHEHFIKTLKKYSKELESIEKEYDTNELNFNKQTTETNNNFLLNHDLNKFSDEKMKLNIGK